MYSTEGYSTRKFGGALHTGKTEHNSTHSEPNKPAAPAGGGDNDAVNTCALNTSMNVRCRVQF